MKYRTTAAFDRDFARLPAEHRAQFTAAVRDHFLPAIAAGAFTGTPPGRAGSASTAPPTARPTRRPGASPLLTEERRSTSTPPRTAPDPNWSGAGSATTRSTAAPDPFVRALPRSRAHRAWAGRDWAHGRRRPRVPHRARHDGRGQGPRRRAVAGADPARRRELPDLRPRPGAVPDPGAGAGQGRCGAGQRPDRRAGARRSPTRSPPRPTRSPRASTTPSSPSTSSRPAPAPAPT